MNAVPLYGGVQAAWAVAPTVPINISETRARSLKTNALLLIVRFGQRV